MFIHSFDKRPLTKNSQRVSAGVFARNFYLELKQKALDDKRTLIDPKKEEFARGLIEMIEKGSTINLKQEINGKIEFTNQNQVRMTYSRSNLGRGFIFWFICGVCGRKVRYLYIPPNSQVLACRTCHRLAYGQQNEGKRFRRLNKLLK